MLPLSSLDPACAPYPDPAPVLEEIAATSLNRAASVAFALSRCDPVKPLLFVVPRAALRELAWPSLHGIGSAAGPLLMASTNGEADALWAMEQALKSGALGGVIGVIEQASLTQSRRIDFAARDGATAALLLRLHGNGLSAARRRWRVTAAPSLHNPHDAEAPGQPRLIAELWRRRDGPPGRWVLARDGATHRFDLADRLGADGLATAPRRAA